MGQAKRRGSFEERKKEAILRDAHVEMNRVEVEDPRLLRRDQLAAMALISAICKHNPNCSMYAEQCEKWENYEPKEVTK
jgi:hypothetical protein